MKQIGKKRNKKKVWKTRTREGAVEPGGREGGRTGGVGYRREVGGGGGGAGGEGAGGGGGGGEGGGEGRGGRGLVSPRGAESSPV